MALPRPEIDIRHERSKAAVDPEAMTEYLYGGKTNLARVRKVKKLIEDDPVFRVDDYYFASRQERYERALEKTIRLVELVRDNGVSKDDAILMRLCIREQLPLGLHWVMFIPAIKGQGTEEQQAKWLPLAETLQIVGTYAQTEMGHGTFLRGLETTATYDPSTQAFDLHSPTLTSIKWWPGTLGKTATHCVVMARLITKGKDHGTHAFIVQLRDLETHMPLPGVKVGDIGPKLGYDSMDNGFLQLTHVKIPLDQMLMKFAKVAPDGTYSKPPNTKLSYGTMIYVRSVMISDAARHLQAATTIAVRYAAVRRQSLMDEDSRDESQVLDYNMVQRKVFPLIAAGYACHFAGMQLVKLYNKLQESLNRADLSLLEYVHGTTTGLKFLVTTIASEGLETCRKACGGHGYSKFSGLPDFYQDYVPACTYEGENTVMALQCARFLIKCSSKLAKNKSIAEPIQYLKGAQLKQQPSLKGQSFGKLDVQLQALEIIACLALNVAQDQLKVHQQRHSGGQAWNLTAAELSEAAKCHSQLVLVRFLRDACQQAQNDNTRSALTKLTTLMACCFIEPSMADLRVAGVVDADDVTNLKQEIANHLALVRRDAVALVDAFDLSDHFLNSALGRKDGNVYQALFDYAQKEPLNQTQVRVLHACRHVDLLTTHWKCIAPQEHS
eukprot:TRINITY_DN12600_c1_g2_i29.p1 TRINITY_DN12600_c1_g2~~TRINITY_DN12600_c1_g2_i29.p1  ORF type:complete len:668 (+),score=194.81 TRINITY_DN12600_c1_g2_i29:1242-3245(+)